MKGTEIESLKIGDFNAKACAKAYQISKDTRIRQLKNIRGETIQSKPILVTSPAVMLSRNEETTQMHLHWSSLYHEKGEVRMLNFRAISRMHCKTS